MLTIALASKGVFKYECNHVYETTDHPNLLAILQHADGAGRSIGVESFLRDTNHRANDHET